MILAALLCRALNDKYKNTYKYVIYGTNDYAICRGDHWIMHINDIRIYVYGKSIDIISFDDPKIDVFAAVCKSLYDRGHESHP
jgi:hypothetical protein